MAKAACNYDVSGITAEAPAKKNACENAIGDTTEKCAYISGDTCTPRKACSEYDGSSVEACSAIVDINGIACSWVNAATKCSNGACTLRTNATS